MMKQTTLAFIPTARHALALLLLAFATSTASFATTAAACEGEEALQPTLSLDSCRSMALRQGKTLLMASMEKQKAHYEPRAARAN